MPQNNLTDEEMHSLPSSFPPGYEGLDGNISLQELRGIIDTTTQEQLEAMVAHALRQADRPTIENDVETAMEQAIGPFNTDNADQKCVLVKKGPHSHTYRIGGYVIQLTMPLYRKAQTNSKLSTMRYVNARTCLRVPEAKPPLPGFNLNVTNPTGHEYIITKVVKGKSLGELWTSPNIDLEAKKNLVRHIAKYVSQLYGLRISISGNLEVEFTADQHGNDMVAVGIRNMLWDMPHAPSAARNKASKIYRNNLEWAKAHLYLKRQEVGERLIQLDSDRAPTSPVDPTIPRIPNMADDDAERRFLQRAEAVLASLDKHVDNLIPFFLQTEESSLSTQNLTMDNIRVDEFGAMTGVTGWGMVPYIPLGVACSIPPFLQGRTVTEETDPGVWCVDDGYTYGIDKACYEKTILRQIFIEEMQTLAPEWITWYQTGITERDLHHAIKHCTDPYAIDAIERWARSVEDPMNIRALENDLINLGVIDDRPIAAAIVEARANEIADSILHSQNLPDENNNVEG